jgi:hypothetical protein
MSSPTASRIAVGLVALLVAGGLAGCGSDRPARPAAVPATATGTAAASPPRPLTLADAKRCPVTLPRRGGPPGASPDSFFGWGDSYGNGKLWVGGLWPHGVIDAGPEFVAKDGSVGMKFGWWRAVAGRLRISGRRLDAAAPPARGDVPEGYGDRGFQASGVHFPTEGCWQVTGKVGSTTLTFVTYVVKQAG